MDAARFDSTWLVRAGRYQETMDLEVLPYLEDRGEDLTVSGRGGCPLFVSFFTAENPRGTVFIVHGFTENAFKFSELIFSLVKNGYHVCAYDQRGHGRSWRDPVVAADPSLTHVDDFTDYVHDLDVVVGAVGNRIKEPLMVFCHSMGGAVTGLFMEQNPGVFKRAVFCAPMIAPNTGVSNGMARALSGCLKALGRGKRRMTGHPYSGPEDFATSCASGRERFDWYDAVKAANKAFYNNGPTVNWVHEAVKVTGALLAPGAVERITVPVRVYGAETDSSVLPGPQQAFADRLPDGRRTVVKGARHEIYRSPDAVLFPWWKEILEFYAE